MSAGAENRTNSNTTIAVLIVSTIAFVGVFLSSRSADVGKLPQLVSGIFSGNLFSFDGFAASVSAVFIAVLISAAWFGLGRFITRFFETNDEFYALSFARSGAFGAAAWSLIWFFTGLVSGYNRYTATAFLVVGLIAAIYFGLNDWRFLKTKNEADSSTNIFGKIAFGLIVFTIFLTLVAALAPPTAKDALLYHAALPKQFVAQGGNQIVEGNIASFLALGVEMHSVWAMLLGNFFSARTGEAAMGATIFSFTLLLLLAIYGWAREFGIEKNWAILAASLVAAIPTAFHVASSVYVDLALALYITLAIQSIGKWWNDLQTTWLVFAAIALGAALTIKLTTVFVIAALALVILLRARDAQNKENMAESENLNQILLNGFGALILAGLIASPWYLRTWAKTGSPIFPFYMSVWKGTASGWDTERSALFQAMNSNYGGTNKTVFDYLLAPLKISFFAQPEVAENYDGVLGVSFLLGLILIIWAWRKYDFPVELKIAVGVSGIVFLFWLFSSEQLRYLLPIVPSLAVASVVAANLISQKDETLQKWIFVALLATSMVGVLTSVAWFAEKNPLRVVLGGETRDEYLSRRLDYYEYYKIVNRDLPTDAKVWLINMRRDSYNLERAYFSDYLFEDWTLRNLVEQSEDANDLRQKARALGITHVLARHDFLLDFRRTPIIDEKRSEQENRTKLKIAEDFIIDKTNQIRADEKFSLVKLP